MKSKVLITVLLAVSLLLTACGGAEEQDETPTQDMTTLEVPVTGVTATIEVTATESLTETPPAEATATESASTQVSTVGTATELTVMVNNEGTPAFLVDGQGRALYIFTKDTPNTSACMDDCAVDWPPVLVTGTPTAGEGVDSALLGTLTRADGQMQATYNSWPLYYSDDDVNPGDTNGQGVDGEWFLISPTGEPIQV